MIGIEKGKTYLANKFSGTEGNMFLISIIAEVIREANARLKFEFPFYGFSLDLEKEKGDEWIRDKEYEKASESLLGYVAKNGTGYFSQVRTIVLKETADFEKKARNAVSEIKNLSDENLAKSFFDFTNLYAHYYGLGAFTFLYEHMISEWLAESFLKKNIEVAGVLEKELESNYESFMIKGHKALIRIHLQKNRKLRKKLIDKFKKDFFFIAANYRVAPILTDEVVLQKVRETAKQEKANKKTDKKKKHHSARIKLSTREKNIIKILRFSEAIRDQRKKLNLIGSYVMMRFLEEAARRKKINPKLASRLFWFEFEKFISETRKIIPVLKKRKAGTVIFDGKRTHYLEGLAICETEAQKKKKFLKGTPASKGKIKGKVRIILSSKDFRKMKSGEILVAQMTRPDYLPVMNMAAGIVTDEGGLTCHAAIVARERDIPAVVGARGATTFLKTGDLAELDADRGIIKKIRP